jgi:hypothetical protein
VFYNTSDWTYVYIDGNSQQLLQANFEDCIWTVSVVT